MQTFTVGQLAQKANVNIETVRYYEKMGLLPKPVRNQSGFRQYKEIDELFSLKIDSETTCGDVKQLALHKIEIVNEKIFDLQKIKKKLEELVVLSEKENISTNECPIIEAL